MSLAGQRVDPRRYTVLPRCLIFGVDGDRILLLHLPAERGPWGGLYNGIGGHVEAGEDPRSAARREFHEETGLAALALILAGVVMIATGSAPGIGLYVFVARVGGGTVTASHEGQPTWVARDEVGRLPLVADLPTLLPRALAVLEGEPPFSAVYRYDEEGRLSISFGEQESPG
jgi:8-oxo-dGTP diphosphatase